MSRCSGIQKACDTWWWSTAERFDGRQDKCLTWTEKSTGMWASPKRKTLKWSRCPHRTPAFGFIYIYNIYIIYIYIISLVLNRWKNNRAFIQKSQRSISTYCIQPNFRCDGGAQERLATILDRFGFSPSLCTCLFLLILCAEPQWTYQVPKTDFCRQSRPLQLRMAQCMCWASDLFCLLCAHAARVNSMQIFRCKRKALVRLREAWHQFGATSCSYTLPVPY